MQHNDPPLHRSAPTVSVTRQFFNRLLDFRRDLTMMDIHVREVLEVVSPLGRSKTLSPPIAEDKLRADMTQQFDPANRLFLVEGHAGSGKSTMLRSWVLKLLESTASDPEARRPVSIYLALRHLPPSTVRRDIELSDLVACLRRTLPSLTDEAARYPFERIEALRQWEYQHPARVTSLKKVFKPLEWAFSKWPLWGIQHAVKKRIPDGLKRKKKPPEWILLCDGLDELPHERLPDFVRWFSGLPTSVCVVVTSRPDVLQHDNVSRSRQYKMCDFNDDQIKQFITRWFRSDTDLRNRFLEKIHAQIALRQLAGIPLLLTFLSIDVEVRRDATFPDALPQSDLLGRIVAILLDQWNASKENRLPDTAFITRATSVFTSLAMAHPYGATISHLDLVQTVHTLLPTNESADATTFLTRLLNGTQLLYGNPLSGYCFRHAIFFDYFFSRGVKAAIQSRGLENE